MKISEIFRKNTAKPAILAVGAGAETMGRITLNTELDSYDIKVVDDGAAALLMLPRVKPRLIVLDVELTTVSWINFYKLVRQEQTLAGTPILILTNTVEEVANLTDFNLGNTDFLVKPFAPQELSLRARRLLFKQQTSDLDADILDYDDLRLDVARHEVTVQGDSVYLTATEFKLLATLAQRQGRVQTRERLLQDVCAYNTSFLETRTIDTHMRRLRSRLGPARWHLETVRGIGYQFRDKPLNQRCAPKLAAPQPKRRIPASPRFKEMSASLS
jgi:DNA-binding response OmpR family regulator